MDISVKIPGWNEVAKKRAQEKEQRLKIGLPLTGVPKSDVEENKKQKDPAGEGDGGILAGTANAAKAAVDQPKTSEEKGGTLRVGRPYVVIRRVEKMRRVSTQSDTS